MNYTNCEKCRRFLWGDDQCGCRMFTVIGPNGERDVFATDEEEAALEYARDYNEDGDYSLMNKTKEVEVISASGDSKKFNISAEPDINYSADEIEASHD